MAQKDLGVGTKIAVGYTLALVALVLVTILARRNSMELLATSEWVSHTHEVLETLAKLSSTLREAESTSRGYAITADPAQAAEAATVRPRVQVVMQKLGRLTSDNPQQQQRLRELSPLVARKLDFNEKLIAKRREQGADAAYESVRAGEGITIMRDIDDLTESFGQTETALLQTRTSAAQQSATDTGWLTFGLMLGGALVVVTSGVLIGRDITQSVAARDELIAGTREAIHQLGSATAELLAAASQQGSGAQEQAAAIAETATTAEEIAQTAVQSADRSQSVAQVSQHAVEMTSTGKRAVDDTMRRISELKERVSAMAQSILTLSQHASSIGELNASVGEIAEQSNILALNAAIEASRAGEQGRGFAVVADEVRALADQSKKATKQVRQLLGDMQRETNRAVIITEEGTKSADGAVRAAGEAGELFRDLSRTVSESAQAALQVAASASQQASGVSQIQQAMRDINQVTTQSLSSTRQIESASQDLSALSVRLRGLVGVRE
jgi:methyl-accepting chemotaxis protein